MCSYQRKELQRKEQRRGSGNTNLYQWVWHYNSIHKKPTRRAAKLSTWVLRHLAGSRFVLTCAPNSQKREEHQEVGQHLAFVICGQSTVHKRTVQYSTRRKPSSPGTVDMRTGSGDCVQYRHSQILDSGRSLGRKEFERVEYMLILHCLIYLVNDLHDCVVDGCTNEETVRLTSSIGAIARPRKLGTMSVFFIITVIEDGLGPVGLLLPNHTISGNERRTNIYCRTDISLLIM